MRHLAITAAFFILALVVRVEATPTQIVVVAPSDDYQDCGNGGFRNNDFERAVCGALTGAFKGTGTRVINQLPPAAKKFNEALGLEELHLPPGIKEMWLVSVISTGNQTAGPSALGYLAQASGYGYEERMVAQVTISAKVITASGEKEVGPFEGSATSKVTQLYAADYGSLSLKNLALTIGSGFLSKGSGNPEADAFGKAWQQFSQAIFPSAPTRPATNSTRRTLPVIRPQ